MSLITSATASDELCGICLEPLNNSWINSAVRHTGYYGVMHPFHRHCLQSVERAAQGVFRCPMCRTQLDAESLYSLQPETIKKVVSYPLIATGAILLGNLTARISESIQIGNENLTDLIFNGNTALSLLRSYSHSMARDNSSSFKATPLFQAGLYLIAVALGSDTNRTAAGSRLIVDAISNAVLSVLPMQCFEWIRERTQLDVHFPNYWNIIFITNVLMSIRSVLRHDTLTKRSAIVLLVYIAFVLGMKHMASTQPAIPPPPEE